MDASRGLGRVDAAGGEEIGEPWPSAFGTSKKWRRSLGEIALEAAF
jgi:hypothetical protein